MALPKYDNHDKISQKIFYSELKRQLDIIEKIEDRRERNRRMSKLKLDVYNAINNSQNEIEVKKTFLSLFFIYLKQVIINIINRVKKGISL
jgi:hypothetical protein